MNAEAVLILAILFTAMAIGAVLCLFTLSTMTPDWSAR